MKGKRDLLKPGRVSRGSCSPSAGLVSDTPGRVVFVMTSRRSLITLALCVALLLADVCQRGHAHEGLQEEPAAPTSVSGKLLSYVASFKTPGFVESDSE